MVWNQFSFHLVPHFEECLGVTVMSGFIIGEHLIFPILIMAGLKVELAINSFIFNFCR
jgi:hypothetical protein